MWGDGFHRLEVFVGGTIALQLYSLGMNILHTITLIERFMSFYFCILRGKVTLFYL